MVSGPEDIIFILVILMLLICIFIAMKNTSSRKPLRICKTDHAMDISADKVDERLTMVPEKLIENFISRGWQIVVTGRNIEVEIPNINDQKYTIGTMSIPEKTIYVPDNDEAIYAAPIHELGKFLDQVLLDGYSQTDKFKLMYQIENSIFNSMYIHGVPFTEQECFACSFWQYIMNPVEFKQCCPLLYESVQEALDMIY